MTAETILGTHRGIFYRALLEQDWEALENLYGSEYKLVRSDGSVLDRTMVLKELREQKLVFESIDLTDADVRIVGSVAILTGESRTQARRSGTLVGSRFRLVALYTQSGDTLHLIYFQSTGMPSPTATV